MKSLRLAILPALALAGGLAACAPYPAEGYYTVPPPSVAAVPPTYRNDYATQMPAYVGQAPVAAPGVPYAAAVDPYCREAFANAAGTQQQASMTGTYADAARAQRSADFYRRDCR
ncbi:hypothetical protein [Roseomonas indoligenes]|uniref:Glycine zipper family protein n=1 Tax=Roseomonas indoligenes TaxID=2820811 RepID=A0A940MX30_9PROT|nr:hypothetical protein [Pararoseomonas indoligenes]MBP0492076.1 hypothetical protein [Pararoseomonas indoligenes]